MPGDAKRVPVKPSDVFPLFVLPEQWRQFVAPQPADAMPDKMAFVKLLAQSGALWRYAGGSAQVLLGHKTPTEAPLRSEIPKNVMDRLEHELRIVEQVGYADYFLIVWDICREAAWRGIPFLARGSAADSLLCYVLGISTVCPLRFQLYFERFLNPERMKFSKLADIDLDFPWDQRDEIMQYVFDRWGHAHVAMIGGFSRYQARMAVADIGKTLGLSEQEVRYFTKRLPRVSADMIAASLDQNVRLKEVPLHEEPYDLVIELAKRLTDMPRHPMMHPCGIVISREPLRRITPLLSSGRGWQMTQYGMDAVEDLGMVKIDLLGQAGLSVLRDVLQRVAERYGERICLETLPWEDARTWEMIATGGARGIHHIESPAMTTLLVQSNCRDMDCLCAIVSVIRPGAADESKKLMFTRRHQGLEPVEYPHPSLEPYLRDTYGLLVFEEHILMVAHHFAGMNLGRSDVLRRELVKMKNPEKLIELGYEFRDCALALGRTEEEVRQVWRTLVAFHGYMFNKAHSASYAVEAFQGAWLKARYPAIYMAAVLSNQRGFYTPLFYSLECRRLGLRFLLPDVNAASLHFEAEGSPGHAPQAIRIPWRRIKGLSHHTLQQWQQALKNGPFRQVEDFMRRVMPHDSEVPLLIDSGVLDTFLGANTRAHLFWKLKRLQHQMLRVPSGAADELLGLEMPCQPTSEDSPHLWDLTPPAPRQQAEREWELFGLPVTTTPWEVLGPHVRWDTYCSVARLGRFLGQKVTLCGLIVQTRHNHTLRGEVMLFFTLADASGYVECTVFPRVYRRFGHHLLQHRLVAITGRVEPFDNQKGQTLNVQRVQPAAEIRT
jgi:DNA-directed DNA polymerase III PolC